ncbi:hypothetical protein IVA96_02195 [Bradyrhizobium sp. 159]|uniref:hypothetical protein n=1 Tax=Bradyrhizobium sp. 159 TaxID=2782632 RepID=UPI001FFA2C56|nr:hypothetical protein [Bradyrhizobium sp. 159]MCK1615524.1 hypothetical protein [Bradyrhizobium sp. 159]
MMGHRQVEQTALFYEFSLERHIPTDHLLRLIDRFVDLEQVRRDLAVNRLANLTPRIAASANVTLMARMRSRLVGRAM